MKDIAMHNERLTRKIFSIKSNIIEISNDCNKEESIILFDKRELLFFSTTKKQLKTYEKNLSMFKYIKVVELDNTDDIQSKLLYILDNFINYCLVNNLSISDVEFEKYIKERSDTYSKSL